MHLNAQVKLCLLFIREFYDLLGTLYNRFFPSGKFHEPKQLWQDKDEGLGQGAPLSHSLMKNTLGPRFGC